MPRKLKICHNYNKNERLRICKWWLYEYSNPKRMRGSTPQKAIVSTVKKQEEITFPSEQIGRTSSEDSQGKAERGWWLPLLCAQNGAPMLKNIHIARGALCSEWMSSSLFRNECVTSKEKSDQKLKKERSYLTEGNWVQDKEIQFSTHCTAFLHQKLLLCFYFGLVLKTGSKSSSSENDWHIGIPCSLLPRGRGFFKPLFALFLTHLLSGSIRKWQAHECLCVCVCARDYKSHSPNGISVLLARSFHAWQMTTLSAHNTIFLLPRL